MKPLISVYLVVILSYMSVSVGFAQFIPSFDAPVKSASLDRVEKRAEYERDNNCNIGEQMLDLNTGDFIKKCDDEGVDVSIMTDEELFK